jgi:hypothetical protein
VVIGDNGLATSIILNLYDHDWAGFHLAGYLGASPIEGEHIISRYGEINTYLESQVDQIWIAMPLANRERDKRNTAALALCNARYLVCAGARRF